jgi:predicted ATPase
MLLDRSAQHGLAVWHALGRCIKSVLIVKGGALNTGVRLLRTALDQLDEFKFALYRAVFLSALAEGLAGSGQVTDGLGIIDEAIVRSERTEEYWSMAELLRVKGELLLLRGAPNAVLTAEEHFQQALDWSRRQEALSWELRAATSLARLWHQQHRTSLACKLLAPVYRRFTEGLRLPPEQVYST